MRRHERQVTEKDVLEGYIGRCFFMTLAMVDDGKPYALPMNFGYENGIVYMHSALAGKKVDLLRRAGSLPVQLVFVAHAGLLEKGGPDGPACSLSSSYTSVIAEGELEEVTDAEEALRGMRTILRQTGMGKKALPENSMKSVLMLKVRLAVMTGKANNA